MYGLIMLKDYRKVYYEIVVKCQLKNFIQVLSFMYK